MPYGPRLRVATHVIIIIIMQFNSRLWCPLVHMKSCKAGGTVIVPWWPKREWRLLLRACNRASWALSVVSERCLNVNRQADVFLPGPGSANTIVVEAPKWAVYALRVDLRSVK